MSKLNKGDVVVCWSDRDYNSKKKYFRNDPQGAPENALIKARKYAKKLEKDLVNVRTTPRIEFV